MKIHFTQRVITSLVIGCILVSFCGLGTCQPGSNPCQPSASATLSPVPGAAWNLKGKAELFACPNLTPYLHIVLSGNAPDGTELIPVFRSKEPIMGSWFTVTGGHAETNWENASFSPSFLAGKTLSIDDMNYADVVSGQF
jgi:hypothetical protein